MSTLFQDLALFLVFYCLKLVCYILFFYLKLKTENCLIFCKDDSSSANNEITETHITSKTISIMAETNNSDVISDSSDNKNIPIKLSSISNTQIGGGKTLSSSLNNLDKSCQEPVVSTCTVNVVNKETMSVKVNGTSTKFR